MTNLSVLAAAEPPSDLAGRDLEGQTASQAWATYVHGGPALLSWPLVPPGKESLRRGQSRSVTNQCLEAPKALATGGRNTCGGTGATGWKLEI